MNVSEPTITIPVGDWVEEYQREEPNLSTKDVAIHTHQRHGYKPQQMGRLLAIARLRDETFDDIPPAKPMLNVGYAVLWSRLVKDECERVTLANGKSVLINSLVGPGSHASPEDASDDPEALDANPAYVSWDDALAVGRIDNYLFNAIPGHIYNRLKQLAARGEDLSPRKEQLHGMIDGLFARLE